MPKKSHTCAHTVGELRLLAEDEIHLALSLFVGHVLPLFSNPKISSSSFPISPKLDEGKTEHCQISPS